MSPPAALPLTLRCRCGHEGTLSAGMVRERLDDDAPDMQAVMRLVGHAACPACGGREASMEDAGGRALYDPARRRDCVGCGHPIALPRLGASPDTTLCGPCMAEGTTPKPPPPLTRLAGAPTRCPRCGAATQTKLRREDAHAFTACSAWPACRWRQAG